MNDLVNSDLKKKIADLLLCGKKAMDISNALSCDVKTVFEVFGSDDFSQQIQGFIEKDIKISGFMALRNIKKIAEDETGSKATQLKANQWLAEKALEFSKIGSSSDSPATMTQDQLARRLNELQAEALKRAKPIDTGVIEQVPDNLSDMLE